MNLDQIKTLLSREELDTSLSEVASLLSRRISNNEISSFDVSTNDYPASHFREICSSRIDYLQKNQLKIPPGMKETVDLLGQYKGQVRVGYTISTKKEKFAIHFQKDLNSIVALYCTDHIDPITIEAT